MSNTSVSLLLPLRWGTGGTRPRCISLALQKWTAQSDCDPSAQGCKYQPLGQAGIRQRVFPPPTSRKCCLPHPLLGQSEEEEQPTALNTPSTQPERGSKAGIKLTGSTFCHLTPLFFYKTKVKHLVTVWRPTSSHSLAPTMLCTQFHSSKKPSCLTAYKGMAI